ncbi:hypothetical protein [Ralstonia phage RP13]|nr:hypothetical protein [Ralstonia phage RP13]
MNNRIVIICAGMIAATGEALVNAIPNSYINVESEPCQSGGDYDYDQSQFWEREPKIHKSIIKHKQYLAHQKKVKSKQDMKRFGSRQIPMKGKRRA